MDDIERDIATLRKRFQEASGVLDDLGRVQTQLRGLATEFTERENTIKGFQERVYQAESKINQSNAHINQLENRLENVETSLRKLGLKLSAMRSLVFVAIVAGFVLDIMLLGLVAYLFFQTTPTTEVGSQPTPSPSQEGRVGSRNNEQ